MSNSRELQHLRSISDGRMPGRKHRRDKSEISCCLKYLIFGFNVIFWLLGLGIFVVGIWAWTEKDIFNNLSRLTNIALDPAFVLIVAGIITFTIGFTGCVGALRENTCLLAARTDENEKDTFYSQLQDILNSVKKGDISLVLGDFDAKVGTDSDLWAGVLGPFGIGSSNGNGEHLLQYAIFLAILLLLEMTAGTLGFIFKDWIKNQATNGFQAFIIHYREDPDRQNLIDWIQEQWHMHITAITIIDNVKILDGGCNVKIHTDNMKAANVALICKLECCGIEGPKDWDMNVYFNCSSIDVGSREACGVPFSCCKPQPNELIRNNQCGYDVRKQDYTGDKSTVIYEKGCLRAGEEWIEANLVPVAGVSVGVAVLQERDRSRVIFEKGCLQSGEEWVEKNLLPLAGVVLAIAFAQILGICFAQNLRADIFAQKAKWH